MKNCTFLHNRKDICSIGISRDTERVFVSVSSSKGSRVREGDSKVLKRDEEGGLIVGATRAFEVHTNCSLFLWETCLERRLRKRRRKGWTFQNVSWLSCRTFVVYFEYNFFYKKVSLVSEQSSQESNSRAKLRLLLLNFQTFHSVALLLSLPANMSCIAPSTKLPLKKRQERQMKENRKVSFIPKLSSFSVS